MNVAAASLGVSHSREQSTQANVSRRLTDAPNFPAGHATLEEPTTGRSVIVCPESTVGGAAAEVVAAAIRVAVRQATSRADVPDKHSTGARSPDERAWSAGQATYCPVGSGPHGRAVGLIDGGAPIATWLGSMH